MIINGGSRCNWRFFAKHLMKGEENERVEITEIRGLAGDTVLEALREMDALASGTRCKNFFYHANLNPRADEHLTPEQWERAIDTLESNLGLDGHSRFIVEHQKEGRSHRHVIWSRIDTDSMTAASDSNNYEAHERTARELEQAFGLSTVQGAHVRSGRRPKRRPKAWETFRGHQSGVDPNIVSRELTELWRQADSGKAFAASLAANGYRLCKGDRRDFCVLDAAGDAHSLARRIDGAKAATIRARMADIDRDALPSVQDATPIEPARGAATALAAGAQGAAMASPGTTPAPASALDAFAHQVCEVMQTHGGDPHLADGLTWIERSVTVLGAAREQVAGWVKGRWQDLVDRFGSRGHHETPPDHDRER
jgi:hypothetical protein